MRQEKWEQSWRDPCYAPMFGREGAHQPVRDAVQSGWLSLGASVLELACGAGQGAAWLQQRGFTVLAIDFSSEAIRLARRDYGSLERLSFEVADATKPGIIPGTFDAVIDTGCFQGVFPGDHMNFFRNVVAWSRPGTRFLMMTQCVDYRPEQRKRQVDFIFKSAFDLEFCEAKTGVLPRAPHILMMTFRFVRKHQ